MKESPKQKKANQNSIANVQKINKSEQLLSWWRQDQK
jgi:hypothetical protein